MILKTRLTLACAVLLPALLLLPAASSHAELILLKQNSPPKYMSHNSPGGTHSPGLCEVIYQSMQQRMEKAGRTISIDPEHYPIKRVLAMLSTGKGHVFCGANRDEVREKMFIYSTKPLFTVHYVVMKHISNPYEATSLKELQDQNALMGAYFGTHTADHLKTIPGIRVADHYKSLDEALNAVASKTIPYFFYHDLGLDFMIRQSKLPVTLMRTRFLTQEQWMLYSPTLSAQDVDLLNRTITSLHDDGTLETLRRQYD